MEQKEVCEKVVRILNMVLESCQDKLSRTLTNSLPDLSSRMLAKGLISHSVKESGGFDQIMQEFQSGWGFSDSVYDLEEQCFKFLNTLCDMRGAPAKAAKKLEKDWSKEVEKQLTDITFLRRQKNKKSHSTPVNVVAIRPNINRKSYSETHSHGTSMESHHNHHDTDSTQPFTSDIENLKRDQAFLDSIEETVSTDSFKTEDIYVPGEEEQDLQTRSTINLSSPPNLLVPGQTKHQPSSLTFSQLQSEYSGHPVTTTPSRCNSIPVTDSSTTFQPPPAISHGPFQEERLEQGMELEVVTPKQATIQTESQSKSANSQPLSSAHSSCSEYIQHLKDENQTLAAEKERFEKKKDKSERAFVSMLKRENRELKKQVSELLKERRDQDEREKVLRRRETLLFRKEEQLEERQKQQDQREEKHDDKNQKRKMHWEKQDEELDQRYTNLGIQKKKLNLLRSQLDQKKDELKTKEQELKDEKDEVKRKKNHLTVLIILVVILLVVLTILILMWYYNYYYKKFTTF